MNQKKKCKHCGDSFDSIGTEWNVKGFCKKLCMEADEYYSDYLMHEAEKDASREQKGESNG